MRLGIVGTGMIVQEVLPELVKITGIECAALCATPRSKEKLEKLCMEYQIAAGFTDYEEMLSSNIDTVYVAVPNKMHYEMARKALQQDKNVIIEKPITSDIRQTEELIKLAHLKNLFLFEAITTQHQGNYRKIRELLPQIGKVKIVQCNFSQYSSRYDRFLQGEVAPVFDPTQDGGALNDLNLYNIHYVAGLFGQPIEVSYHANMELPGGITVTEPTEENKQAGMIDVSGVVTLDYPDFTAVCIAAKDCGSPASLRIQGTKGYLIQDTTPNVCGPVTLVLNDGTTQTYDENGNHHRMVAEFVHFEEMIRFGLLKQCYELLETSRIVSRILSECRI